MVRSLPRFAVAVIGALLAPASVSFHAQSSPTTHAVTFAELTYGSQIDGLAADPSGGVWFAGKTCSTTLSTTAGALQSTAPSAGCNGMFGRMTRDGAITYLSYLGASRDSGLNKVTQEPS